MSVATTASAWARQVQRLDSAPGAEVERPGDRLAQGQARARGRGGADAEHVVVGDADVRAVEAGREVGDHPQVAVLGGVRADVEQGAYLAAGGTEEAGVLGSATSPGRARSASSVETAVWSRNSRISVASGEPSRVRQ